MSGQGAGSESSVASGEQCSLIGTSPPRYDGVDKVTGRAEYGADVCLVGSLHGKVLRSPHAHARIRSIDTRCAEALPGVEAVVTAEDLPQADGPAETNYRYLSGDTLARDKVLYVGHAIAAVAATSPHIAERATHPIRVDY
jgi:xanthine dehydrogenase molybdenum-binding subunit